MEVEGESEVLRLLSEADMLLGCGSQPTLTRRWLPSQLPLSVALAVARKHAEARHVLRASQRLGDVGVSPDAVAAVSLPVEAAECVQFLRARFGASVDPVLVDAITREPRTNVGEKSPNHVGAETAAASPALRRRPSIAASSRDLLRYHSSLAREVLGREREEAQRARAEADAQVLAAARAEREDNDGTYTYPHEGEVLDSASTFFHRLFTTLYLGSGTTILTLATITSQARDAMIEEARDHNFLALAATLHKQVPTIIFLKEISLDAGMWREDARRRQQERHEFLQPVLARTRRSALRERLDFATDRRPGLIDFIVEIERCGGLVGRELVTTVSTCSPYCSGAPPSLIHKVGSPLRFFATASMDEASDSHGPSITLDLRPWVVCVSCYALASVHPVHAGWLPRNWSFEGSFDGRAWITLSQHHDDAAIDGASSNFACWPVSDVWAIPSQNTDSEVPAAAADAEPVQQRRAPPCSLFRIRGTGINALGTHELQVAGIELYGRLLIFQAGSLLEAPSGYFGDSAVAITKQRAVQAPVMPPLPTHPVIRRKGRSRAAARK